MRVKRINLLTDWGVYKMTSLHEFLDEQEQVQEDSFVVDDENKANWALRKIKQYKDKIDNNNALAQAEIDKIEQWNNEVNKQAQESIDYFTSLLTSYALNKKAEDPKFKSLKLPNGRFGFRKSQPKWVYDNDKVIETLEKANLTDFIRVTKAPSKAEIKKAFDVVGDKVVNPDTGEVIEGIEIEPQDDKFNLAVE